MNLDGLLSFLTLDFFFFLPEVGDEVDDNDEEKNETWR